ncbi:flippase-like domain-containing protein [bacterium]|nr:MAG: flippase-like domain-containing protein [bacterium]
MMKKYLYVVLKIAISFGIIFFTVRSIELDALQAQFLKTDPAWIGWSLILLSFSYFLGAFQWRLILRLSEIRISYQVTLGYYYVGLFFNNFLISGMGGDLLRVYDVKKHSPDRERLSPAVATVFFDRFVGLLTLIFLACITGVFMIGRGESIRMFLSIVVLLTIWIMGLVFVLNKKVADAVVKPFTVFIPNKLYERLRHLYHEIHNFRTRRFDLLIIFLISIGVQGLRIMTIWAIGRAMGDESSILYYIIFVPIISLAASLPISIGGTGPREQTTILLFRKIGVTAEIAFSIGFVTYIISMISTVPGALIFFMRKSKHT